MKDVKETSSTCTTCKVGLETRCMQSLVGISMKEQSQKAPNNTCIYIKTLETAKKVRMGSSVESHCQEDDNKNNCQNQEQNAGLAPRALLIVACLL